MTFAELCPQTLFYMPKSFVEKALAEFVAWLSLLSMASGSSWILECPNANMDARTRFRRDGCVIEVQSQYTPYSPHVTES